MRTFAFALIDDFYTSQKFARSYSKGCSPSMAGKELGMSVRFIMPFTQLTSCYFPILAYTTQRKNMR
jgi:hypothetical protein